jgi:hypothetical protein
VPLHRLYGLTVDSPFGLPAPTVAEGPADVTVTVGSERSIPDEPPQGKVLSSVNLGAINYSTTRTGNGYVLRFPGRCDATMNEALSTVELVAASPDLRLFAELLLAGNVLATLLTLRGECVLHASAVATDGRAIAFIGPPGRGKSTLAALACAAGADLITDDVLRPVLEDAVWICPSGTNVIRLRPQAEAVTELVQGIVQRTTDDRVGLSPGHAGRLTPLGAVVFPLPSRTADAVKLTPLKGTDSLMRLTAFPRLLGWVDPEILASSFRWNAQLAREVPTFEAVVPWGPPFKASTARELLDKLDTNLRQAG